MSKLDEVLGYTGATNKQLDDLVESHFGKNGVGGTKDILLIPLKEICLRYKNEYINDYKTFNPLVKTIKENGLLEPIIVARIEDYLPKASEEEKKYYIKMKDLYNSQYFIISGHRRFKAYMTLALNKTIFNDSDIKKFYDANKDDILYILDKKSSLHNNSNGRNKYLYIPCQLTKEISVEKEEKIYNHTNLNARPTTNFEYVMNSIKPSGIIDNNAQNSRENIDIIRTYIFDTYGIDIPNQSIKQYLHLSRELPNKFIQLIFDGKLNIKDATRLTSKIKDIDSNELYMKIKDGNFDYKTEFVNKKSKSASQREFVKKIIKLQQQYGDIKLSELINRLNKK